MTGDRDSLPPGDDSLQRVAEHHKLANDRHEAQLATVVAVTDAQRVAVVREIWAYWFKDRATHLDHAMGRYEAEAKARIEAEQPKAAE
jgi:hypothetical protein